MPNVRLFLRLLADPGWAPALVSLAFLLSVPSGAASRYDFVFHGLGGVAIAYFVWRTIGVVPRLHERTTRQSRLWASLGGSVVAALVWEILEFTADRLLGTNMQHGFADTGRDILLGFLGALAFIAAATFATRPKHV